MGHGTVSAIYITAAGVLRALVHRGGLRARIVGGGVIAEGDRVAEAAR
jgi:hypothetical protein